MNYAVNEEYTDVCRTCLVNLSKNSNKKSLFSIDHSMGDAKSLNEIVMTFASVVIFKEDGLPEYICDSCINHINDVYSFRKLCEKSDLVLRENLNSFSTFTITQNKCVLGGYTCDNNATKYETHDRSTNRCNYKKEETGNDCLREQSHNDCEDDTDDPFCEHSENDSVSEDKQAEMSAESAQKNNGDIYEEFGLANLNDTLHDPQNIDTETWKEYENDKKVKKNYLCKKCGEECLGLGQYRKHIFEVHKEMFKCEECGKEFKSKNVLGRHIKASHVKGRNSKHSEIYRSSRKIKTGIVKTRNLPRTCDICNKTFRFHSNLERHKLIHTGERPYLCNVCGKGFAQLSYLKIHSFIHTGEKPYKCRMCEKTFAAPGTLMTHIRTHTGERPHVCKICGKDFPQSGYLSAHIRTHTGEKPVECKVCNRRFNQSGRLIIHMRIHSGEKPYQCKECGRSFAVKGTLKKHIRTHTGERPYVCSACGQAFAQSGTLATHMKVHRPKQEYK